MTFEAFRKDLYILYPPKNKQISKELGLTPALKL